MLSKIVADGILIFLFYYLSETLILGILCELLDRQLT